MEEGVEITPVSTLPEVALDLQQPGAKRIYELL
jgi:hypothetical protein